MSQGFLYWHPLGRRLCQVTGKVMLTPAEAKHTLTPSKLKALGTEAHPLGFLFVFLACAGVHLKQATVI